ncbi:MAG: cupin domain-containing protein [Clostridia bacterium]|nr:cupin domain-containing protein [Clostridia bacterium]
MANRPMHSMSITDYGKQALIFRAQREARINRNFRTAFWTGEHFQVTLMSIAPGSEVGLEQHKTTDQLLLIEEGTGLTMMGESKDALALQRTVRSGDAVIVPAGTWHNIKNISNRPLKILSVYAPPEHPFGTIHKTKADADKAEY